jgi:hypothetical protein
MTNLSPIEYMGISHGLGALQTAKRIRRIQEGIIRVPFEDQESFDRVAKVNQYFKDVVPTEEIDGTPE